MARTRSARPYLTESWDSVNPHDDFDEDIYNPEDERAEIGASYYSDHRPSRSRNNPILPATNDEDEDVSLEASRNALHNSRTSRGDREAREEIKPRKRGARSSVDKSLVMPLLANGSSSGSSAKARAHTPHFRLNRRSLTSDAGDFNRRTGKQGSASARGAKSEAEYDEEIDNTSDLNWPFLLWDKVAGPVAMYALDVLRIAVSNPITKSFLAIWLLVGALIIGTNLINDTISNALSPICRIPGTGYLNLPFCPTTQYAPEISGPAEFDKLVDVQSKFEDVLQATAGHGFLPLEMKKSEASIRDLKNVVQYSTLPSRNMLVFEFAGFVDTARQASQDLSKFNSRIGRAVDQILSTNRWTLNIIEGVAEKDAAQGKVVKWFSDNLNIFAPFQPIALSRDVLLDQYLRHTGAVEEQITSLISEAHALLTVLDNLDSRLDVIANIAMQDGISVQGHKDELFAQLFVKLGGRRSTVAKLDGQLSLLKDVANYRRMAWAHVNGAVIKLMAIRDSLEDLRERVGMPDVVGDKVPLEVHISNINMGIERLEHQRDVGRKLDQEQFARITAKSEDGDRGIEGRGL